MGRLGFLSYIRVILITCLFSILTVNLALPSSLPIFAVIASTIFIGSQFFSIQKRSVLVHGIQVSNQSHLIEFQGFL